MEKLIGLNQGDIFGKNMRIELFYNWNIPAMLRKAHEYAGERGFVASLPQLVQGRLNASIENEIWQYWLSANTEETVGRSAQGNLVFIESHGNGILNAPGRAEHGYLETWDYKNGAKVSEDEVKDILKGRLPDGSEIPIYSFDEFMKSPDLPEYYAVVCDFDTIRRTTSGHTPFDELRRNPLFLVRAGGPEQAQAYLDKASEAYESEKAGKADKLGNWHNLKRIDTDQPWARFIHVGGRRDKKPSVREFGSCIDFGNNARFLAVTEA